jgi:hypothetical protein
LLRTCYIRGVCEFLFPGLISSKSIANSYCMSGRGPCPFCLVHLALPTPLSATHRPGAPPEDRTADARVCQSSHCSCISSCSPTFVVWLRASRFGDPLFFSSCHPTWPCRARLCLGGRLSVPGLGPASASAFAFLSSFFSHSFFTV